MFNDAENFNQDLNQWQINKYTEMIGMFGNSLLETNPPEWYK